MNLIARHINGENFTNKSKVQRQCPKLCSVLKSCVKSGKDIKITVER